MKRTIGHTVDEVGMAENVLIRRGKGRIVEFTIDGQEFPWWVMDDGIQVQPPTRTQLGTVTVTFPADRIVCEDPYE